MLLLEGVKFLWHQQNKVPYRDHFVRHPPIHLSRFAFAGTTCFLQNTSCTEKGKENWQGINLVMKWNKIENLCHLVYAYFKISEPFMITAAWGDCHWHQGRSIYQHPGEEKPRSGQGHLQGVWQGNFAKIISLIKATYRY